jgi:hypothetical protein
MQCFEEISFFTVRRGLAEPFGIGYFRVVRAPWTPWPSRRDASPPVRTHRQPRTRYFDTNGNTRLIY